jgi:ribosomal protein L7Ae-like RNA K-turn-binding protein
MSENVIITDEERLLGALGMATRARAVIAGVPLICTAMKNGGKSTPIIVFEASDSSENTHKRISDRCEFYGVKRIRLGCNGEKLASAIGKSAPVAAVAVTDENMCRLAEKYIRFAL